MATTSKTTAKKVVNVIELPIHEVEEKAVIVNIQGWRIRAHFDESLNEKKKESYTLGRTIPVEYTGDIEDIHSIKLLPLKGE
ncbi:hypothetical protein [Metabacillus arenae]|uniref:Uncharacterized protein n=1 Tax=Metabacillus arenae TaxID=2771434 RepID=A0A926RWJ1_9BACI|nr:hypothetical protein [Metabacillus arenae]MBD1379217.1 hypothetical protein [Metabacillus arenae]